MKMQRHRKGAIAIKKRDYALSYEGLEEKNNGMGGDRAVAKAAACVSVAKRTARSVPNEPRDAARYRDASYWFVY